MSKTFIIDAATKLFGYYLFNRKQAQEIQELEARLYEAEGLIKDMAYLTAEEKVGQTIEHKDSVIESVQHYTHAYCVRNNVKYEEA